MKTIVTDSELIAKCGLYCGACGSYLKGKCPGCSNNIKATWCKIRACCIENNFKSCADCQTYSNVNDCKKYNNAIARVIGFVLRSNRAACINLIKEKGYESFAAYMAEHKLQSIKR